jgi:YVTN family beta-propeller protein
VINTVNNGIIATVPAGPLPEDMKVTPDGSRLYVTNFTPPTVTVINTTTYGIVATVGVLGGPSGVDIGGPACVGTPKTFTITVNPSPTVVVSNVANDTNNQGRKIVTVTASGGTAPYTFKRCTPPAPGTGCVNGPGGVFSNVLPGSWLFKVTDANGCTGTITTTINPFQDTTGDDRNKEFISTTTGTFDLSLAPNPSSGLVEITVTGAGESSELVIYDPLGRMVWRQELLVSDQKINVDMSGVEFSPGVYRVRLRTAEGTVTKSLVITR